MLLSGAWPKSKAALFEFSEVRQGFTIINNHMDPGRALRFCTGEGLWLLVLRSSAAGMRHAKARRLASFSANRIYQWTWGGTRRLRGKSVLGFVLRWGWPGVLDKVRDPFFGRGMFLVFAGVCFWEDGVGSGWMQWGKAIWGNVWLFLQSFTLLFEWSK